jgi:hypothetical protein
MSEIMSNRILFLEDITKARAPMVEHEAIYFLSACTDSVRRLIDDFDGANKLYKRKRPEKLTCVCVCVCVFSLSLSLSFFIFFTRCVFASACLSAVVASEHLNRPTESR